MQVGKTQADSAIGTIARQMEVGGMHLQEAFLAALHPIHGSGVCLLTCSLNADSISPFHQDSKLLRASAII